MKKLSRERRRKRAAKKIIGYGYVGRWNDGTLGWGVPRHLSFHNRRKWPAVLSLEAQGLEPRTGYLCKITIELVKRKGKPVKRMQK